jgi:hypothetical protein
MTSTSYPRDGADWRGIFIRHVAAAIGRSPNVSLTLWAPPGILPDGVSSTASESERAWLGQLMDRGGISHMLRSNPIVGIFHAARLVQYLRAVFRREKLAELVHVNWLQCALALPRGTAHVVIAVLGNDIALMKVPGVTRLLRMIFRGKTVVLCPNAEWMGSILNRAFGDVATIVPVVFGIGDAWYDVKRDVDFAAPQWLAVTRLTRAKIGPLFEWGERLFNNTNRTLHLFGPQQERLVIPDWVRYHGAAAPDDLLSKWFPKACGLVSLSNHSEGRPQVMLESMAAGLPIVASDIEGHVSLLEGRAPICASPDHFRSAIESLEDATSNERAGQALQHWVKENVGTWDDCAQRYFDVYAMVANAVSPPDASVLSL